MGDTQYKLEESDGPETPETVLESQEPELAKKKSILLVPGFKKMSSKATIQWKEESLNDKHPSAESEDGERPYQLRLETRGTKWMHLQSHLKHLQSSTHGTDESRPSYLQAMVLTGADMTQHLKRFELTPAQQANLTLLKLRVKMDNDDYIVRHPELSILLELVYRQLIKKQPKHPTLFVAEYVHHLNLHREELQLDSVDVPFDRPPPPADTEEPSVADDEREFVFEFARNLVDRCAAIASRGEAFVNVTNILESIMDTLNPSVDITLEEPKRSAVVAVTKVLSSLMAMAVTARFTTAEEVAEDVLATILENLRPSTRSVTEIDFEVKRSIDKFVRYLKKDSTGGDVESIRTREMSSTSIKEDAIESAKNM